MVLLPEASSTGVHMSRRLILAALSLAVAGSLHAEVPAPRDVPYAPGTIKLEVDATNLAQRSEEHTSELQSLMRISYAVFCLKKNKNTNTDNCNDTTLHH